MSANTEDVDYAALELNHEQHIELVETDRVHDEEVGGQMPLAWAVRNCFQVGPPRGAGPRPWLLRTRRIELAETRTPSP